MDWRPFTHKLVEAQVIHPIRLELQQGAHAVRLEPYPEAPVHQPPRPC